MTPAIFTAPRTPPPPDTGTRKCANETRRSEEETREETRKETRKETKKETREYLKRSTSYLPNIYWRV